MSLTKDYTTKLRMALDQKLPAEARAFALCECVFQPVSFATLLATLAFAIANRFGAVMPPVLAKVFPILLSAAVGYLTNWIAIEMLFKPYRRTWRHPFAWLTGGYWRQGLVPKNKEAIASHPRHIPHMPETPLDASIETCYPVSHSRGSPFRSGCAARIALANGYCGIARERS